MSHRRLTSVDVNGGLCASHASQNRNIASCTGCLSNVLLYMGKLPGCHLPPTRSAFFFETLPVRKPPARGLYCRQLVVRLERGAERHQVPVSDDPDAVSAEKRVEFFFRRADDCVVVPLVDGWLYEVVLFAHFEIGGHLGGVEVA